MPLITVAAPPEFYEGVFPGKVTSIKSATKTKQATGETFECFEWGFAIDQTAEDGGEVLDLNEISSQNTGAKSKAGQWLVALIGPEAAEPGTQFDAEDIVGREGMFTIGTNDTGYPKVTSISAKQRRRGGVAAKAEAPKTPVQSQGTDGDGDVDDDLPF